ncbi:hypothetical protein ROZALSC1DRAFT_19903 [Rozella allomycis CSF55]|uniref:C2 domain-containing protein n=1 Tax=Rozella allomycis (strain CSF55) TaxID=988480 RepID=A0A4V1J0N7_ROZAC|nr:hypothetical protein ROZALSC1DRAFT_19903 [Rozella allomycis CSF55]
MTDIVGLVNIDLNPMLAENQQITGWFPIHDTLKGIRGELNILIRWQYFGDVNPFKESALGVQFFACSSLPFDKAGSIIGLVDVITSEDDPEKSHWSDNFRTPRFSNEARQKLLFRLSGYLRNEVAKKVVEMGGNAVIGYTPSFDIENEDRYITARAIGTACKIITPESVRQRSNSVISTPRFIHVDIPSSPKLQPSFVDPDSPFTNDDATHDFPTNENQVNSESSSESRVVKVPELLFLTIKSFPVGAILKIGGVVSAKSIKILQGGDSDIRDTWWTELRDEIKSHARALGCPHVIGYSEKTTIENDLCVFSAVGTAAILDLSQFTKSLDIKETLFSPNMKRRKKKATTGKLAMFAHKQAVL